MKNVQTTELKTFSTLKLQVFISSLPIIQLLTLLPVFLKKLNMPLSAIGAVFFSVRIGGVLGSLSTPNILKRFNLRFIMISCELLSVLSLVSLTLSILNKNIPMVAFSFALRNYCVSLFNNTRNVWLKHSNHPFLAEKVLTFSSTLMESSYFIGGLIYIVANQNVEIFYAILILDIITSLIGAALVYYSPFLNLVLESPSSVQFNGLKFLSTLKLEKNYIFPSIMLLTLAIAFGGTDIICLTIGERIFGESAGYGAGNMMYSAGFFIGSLLHKIKGAMKTSSTTIVGITSIACFSYFLFFKQSILTEASLFIVLFATYGYFYLLQDKVWFRIIDKRKASQGFAIRSLLLMLTIAIGELFYSYFSSIAQAVRLGACIILVITSLTSMKLANLKASASRGS